MSSAASDKSSPGARTGFGSTARSAGLGQKALCGVLVAQSLAGETNAAIARDSSSERADRIGWIFFTGVDDGAFEEGLDSNDFPRARRPFLRLLCLDRRPVLFALCASVRAIGAGPDEGGVDGDYLSACRAEQAGMERRKERAALVGQLEVRTVRERRFA